MDGIDEGYKAPPKTEVPERGRNDDLSLALRAQPLDQEAAAEEEASEKANASPDRRVGI